MFVQGEKARMGRPSKYPEERHLELARYSSTSLARLSRSVERELPTGRTERITVFPRWEAPTGEPLLANVLSRLDELGFAYDAATRGGGRRVEHVASGEAAKTAYLKSAMRENTNWPKLQLLLGRTDGTGVALTSDLDGTTLYIDAWGPDACSALDDVFELIWSAARVT